MRLDNIEEASKDRPDRSFSIMQWSLFATCVFFCSGHWCAFDGLRYGAAFIGFEEFMLVRQAILLAIDTYGFSIILPVFGLPFLVATKYQDNLGKHFLFTQLSQVWGLFAPKFVFNVFELILTDVLICLASIYYFDQGSNDDPELKSSDC
ncbi:GPI ethanolamine phosphate transferase 3-like [Trifolium medium]|uniref:GPI ethanolamine phosphate transferase 3-like n=1 Tax=Trifolium medium TaxID=97028 RepID=A0A392MEF7_9FABA|nr:GPI ethanolamine phosphate transferase 3-like [Trifolium medium]